MKLLLLALLLTGCGVTASEIEAARRLCEPNGGISSMLPTLASAEAYCRNGARFDHKAVHKNRASVSND